MKSRVKLIQPFSALYGCIWRCSKPGCPKVNISFHSIYIATEKMRILVPWPFRRVNFELLESREKTNTAATNIIFSSTTAFHVPKVRSSNNLPYRFFFHLCPFGFLWWEEYIPNGHQIKRNMMINYNGICVVPFNFQTTPCQIYQTYPEMGWTLGNYPKKLLVFMGLSMFIRCFHVASHENKHHFYIVNQ